MTYPITIGTLTLTEPETFNDAGEYAGHARAIRVPAGDYPVLLKRDQWGKLYVVIEMAGTVAHESWTNALGCKRYDNVGEPATMSLQPYAHELARWAAEGRYPVELTDPRYTFKAEDYVDDYDGRQRTRHSLERDGAWFSVR